MNTKLHNLDDLEYFCDTQRTSGKKIVLCHGVFDILHVGHLRHLEIAKQHGDILVVTVTGDQFVNKGPGRPVFSSDLRLEVLAALEFVDAVAVIEEPSALPAIEAVKPSVYVKGKEYSEGDITNKISFETEIVEKYGGTTVYTDDITFSSSNLINNHFNILAEPVRAFLNRIKSEGGMDLIEAHLEEVAKLKVLVIGETIIDDYEYVAPMGKSAKENIVATLHSHRDLFVGGACAAANHLTAISENVEIVTILGDPSQGENFEGLVRENLVDDVNLEFVVRPNGPTVQKTRYVEPTYIRKLFEVYRMDDAPLPKAVQEDFHSKIREKVASADVVIVCDFGHGFITDETIRILEQHAKFLAVNAQSNSANLGYNLITRYHRADFICIDSPETRLATRDKHTGLAQLVSEELPCAINCPSFIVTHGKHGCYTYDIREREIIHIPAFKRDIVDTVGAGDAFFVITAPFLAVGAKLHVAGFMGNVAGGIKVGIVGHAKFIDRLSLMRAAITLMK